MALALSLPYGPEGDTVVALTYCVVVFSILVQGVSIGYVTRKAMARRRGQLTCYFSHAHAGNVWRFASGQFRATASALPRLQVLSRGSFMMWSNRAVQAVIWAALVRRDHIRNDPGRQQR